VFVRSLEQTNSNIAIDWRIGFLGYSDVDFIQYPLKNNANDFAEKLTQAKVVGFNEFTSGAIDYCISGFDWRAVSNKFLLIFTDEILEGGAFVAESINLFPQLLSKIASSKLHLMFFGPQCSYYNQFETISRSVRYEVNDSFASIDFTSLMQSLGKTVSQSCQNQADSAHLNNSYLFDLSSIRVNKIY
jgi:hypothetical protein